jgi:hypothetical protein
VKDFVIYEPLALRPRQTWVLQLTATQSKTEIDEFSFEISSRLVTNPGVNFCFDFYFRPAVFSFCLFFSVDECGIFFVILFKLKICTP